MQKRHGWWDSERVSVVTIGLRSEPECVNGALLNAVRVANLLKKMVGPWGLEPQTSTVSIFGQHDYRLLLKATN